MSRPGLTAEFIFERLAEFVRTDPNWIIREPPRLVSAPGRADSPAGARGTALDLLRHAATAGVASAPPKGPDAGDLRACAQRVPMRPERRGPAPRLSAGTLG